MKVLWTNIRFPVSLFLLFWAVYGSVRSENEFCFLLASFEMQKYSILSLLDFYSMFIIEIVPSTVAVDTTSPVIRPVFSHEVKIRTRSLHLRDSSLIPKFKL